jgi:hypothetical protein
MLSYRISPCVFRCYMSFEEVFLTGLNILNLGAKFRTMKFFFEI